ncbi:MAG: SAM-dependent methyltransferase [Gammaproteobacteria bacterium]|nr:MAG: SAM-dependent methyltransferase [Gammaproteobacteria bacterium]
MNIINAQQKTPLLTGDHVDSKRAELKSYFQNTWTTYNSLFSLINADEAYFLRPEPLRHPLIFYFGHTATFYINKLILGKFINQRVNKRLEAICAVGVDEMSWDDLNSEHYDWPSVDEVRDYRLQVSSLIEQLIDTMDLSLPIEQDSLAWVILMGIEHERIHIETSSVIMRMLELKYLIGSAEQYQYWQACEHADKAPKNPLLTVTGKNIVLGKVESDQTYGWDNEYGQQKVIVDDFCATKYLVSNQEFLGFIEDNGYQTAEYWTEEGQQWLSYSKATMPKFWVKRDNEYLQRNITNEMPLPLNWPVEVNYLEAKAFCHWKNQQVEDHIRLPTEAEWQCLREKITTDLPNWQDAPGNVNLEYYASSCPVDEFVEQGFGDIIGNVWQWTESAIDGYDGFKVHPLYDDFSTPTFDGKHNLIKGGSWISTGNEAIKSARYAFRRHFMQHAGFRYVSAKSTVIPVNEVNRYETDSDVCQQLDLHYFQKKDQNNSQKNTAPSFISENYQQRIALVVKELTQKYAIATSKLLDLGCSVGRTSFELTEHFNFIDAIDFSARYIQHGVQLQQGASVRYISENEGEIVDYNEIKLAQYDLPCAGNILFSQGDASNLKAVFTGYDVVLAQQVLEHNPHPKLFLTTIKHRINTHGLLILLSNYHFEESTMAKEQRLGGLKINGENVTGFCGVEQLLSDDFKLLDQQEIIQYLKINTRNYRFAQLHMTVWQKIS